MVVEVLGPKGTFSHQAVMGIFPKEKLDYKDSISAVFESVDKGENSHGVVPLDNSLEGSINETIDALLKYDLQIVKETVLPIEHFLAGDDTSLSNIKVVLSHPQAVSQCRKSLRKMLPGVEIEFTSSTAKAMETVSKEKKPEKAALGSRGAIDIYGLDILSDNLSDYENNETRFIAISKKSTEATGNDKTSIVVSVKHEPGSLYNLLGLFAKQDINLTKIESRPWRGKGWQYVFFIDFEGHQSDKSVSGLLNEIQETTLFFQEFRFLSNAQIK